MTKLIGLLGFPGEPENCEQLKLAQDPFLFRSLLWGLFLGFVSLFVCFVLFYLHFWGLNDIKLALSEFILKIALRA